MAMMDGARKTGDPLKISFKVIREISGEILFIMSIENITVQLLKIEIENRDHLSNVYSFDFF